MSKYLRGTEAIRSRTLPKYSLTLILTESLTAGQQANHPG